VREHTPPLPQGEICKGRFKPTLRRSLATVKVHFLSSHQCQQKRKAPLPSMLCLIGQHLAISGYAQHSFIRSFVHSFILSFTHPLIHSSIHLFICSFTMCLLLGSGAGDTQRVFASSAVTASAPFSILCVATFDAGAETAACYSSLSRLTLTICPWLIVSARDHI